MLIAVSMEAQMTEAGDDETMPVAIGKIAARLVGGIKWTKKEDRRANAGQLLSETEGLSSGRKRTAEVGE